MGPLTKEKLPKVLHSLEVISLMHWIFYNNSIFFLYQNSPQGSVLVGAISYGKLSFAGQEEGKNPEKNPVSYQISYLVPPNKVLIYLYFFLCISTFLLSI